MSMFSLLALAALPFSCYASPVERAQTCDTVQTGFQCQTDISHNWGQYSPYYAVPSTICADVPPSCSVDFVQILSRHGARNPTTSATIKYNNTITNIHKNVTKFTGPYAFLATYEYTLGANDLTSFGQQEMVNSGIKFFDRYPQLAKANTPFVRSSSEARVVESAQNWTQGFHSVKQSTSAKDPSYPYPIVVISENAGSNNTLNHDLCTAFEDGPDSSIASSAQAIYASTFVPEIQSRLNKDLSGANLSTADVINLMDLCPFNTLREANTTTLSPFCSLFTLAEWQHYNYYKTLNKYYGYGSGNPLGPTQGVGFTNELIARLTSKPVNDSTSTNRSLDQNPATFPLNKAIYADFSHDNDITAILFAMDLYPHATNLSNTTTAEQTAGYSAAWTVPFGARVYFEKLSCSGYDEELVRVIVNDRVLPLENCGGDFLGRCRLSAFVDSLGFARSGGHWSSCFAT